MGPTTRFGGSLEDALGFDLVVSVVGILSILGKTDMYVCRGIRGKVGWGSVGWWESDGRCDVRMEGGQIPMKNVCTDEYQGIGDTAGSKSLSSAFFHAGGRNQGDSGPTWQLRGEQMRETCDWRPKIDGSCEGEQKQEVVITYTRLRILYDCDRL